MRALAAGSRSPQRGAATIALVFVVLVIMGAALATSLSMSSTAIRDASSSEEQIAALFLAEAGLERARGMVNTGTTSYSNGVCTAAAGGPYSLGRGTITLTAVSTPATCTGITCTGCAIRSEGKVGNISRTIDLTLAIGSANGKACNASIATCTNAGAPPATWQLTLNNGHANTAIALFHLANRRQGNQTASACTHVACSLKYTVNAQNGSNSAGGMGNAVTIPSGGSYDIYMTLSDNRNISLVGALFPGSAGGGPAIVGSYWDDTNPGGGGSKTVGRTADSTGQTNNGGANTAGTCVAPTTPTGTKQTCTTWCYGADRLLMGFGGHADSLADQVTAVTFNTAGTPAQNVTLTRTAHYPSAAIQGAPRDIYAEVWYTPYNPNLSPTPIAASASSYKGAGTGAMGAVFAGVVDGSPTATTTMTVTSVTGFPTRIISVGDLTTKSGGPGSLTGSPTIVQQLTSTEAGGALGGAGTYQLSATQSADVTGGTWTANSSVLNVTACTICFLETGDATSGLVSGRTINAAQLTLLAGETTGGIGRYPLSGTQVSVASASTLLVGTPSATIYVPSTSSMPSVTTPATRIARKSGTGVLVANTTVTAVSAPNAATNAITLSTAPTTALNGATLCAGTCAYFDHVGSTTTYTFTKSAGTDYWSSGFMCLSGSDIEPDIVTSVASSATSWSEVVR